MHLRALGHGFCGQAVFSRSGINRLFKSLYVPRRLLIGRAQPILASAQILDHWMPRFRRFGAPIL
jgi:hypothetical protein